MTLARTVFAFTLLLAAVLRLWGVDYGLPHPLARPDEERIVGRALTMVATGNLHPVTFDYPSLPMYLGAAALLAYEKAGELSGRFQEVEDFLLSVAVREPGLDYHLLRLLSVLMGVLTVWAGAELAASAYPRPGMRLYAGLLLATSYVLVRDSRFATVDGPMVLFVTLSLLFAVKAAREKRTSFYVAAGLFAGLATSSKYNAGLLFVSLVAATWTGSRSLKHLSYAALAMAGAFAATSPYAVFYPQAVLDGLRHHQEFLYARPSDRALWTHLSVTFPEGLGWPLLLAAVSGLALAARRLEPADVVLLSFVIPFFAIVASVRMTFPRYVVPLVPPLVALACESGAVLLPRRRSIVAAALAISVAPVLMSSVAFDRVAARKDTRVLASEWIALNLERQTKISLCRGYGAPAVNTDRRRPPAFDAHFIDCDVEAVRREGARYVVVHEHPVLSSYSAVPLALQTWLRENGRPVAAFAPYAPNNHVFFYAADAFYLPFTGLRRVERGGPFVTIWDLGQPPPT